MEQKYFVDKHYTNLVSRVTNVMPIADRLYENDMLGWETYFEIKAMTIKPKQMRELLTVVRSGGPEVKSYCDKALKENEPYLIKDLEKQELSSQATSTSGVPVQGEGAENYIPEEVSIKWNSISKKHKDKLEQFWKDPSKRTLDNISFSENENYIIGLGSSGVVYLGLKKDGTEVAIKRIAKNQPNFQNELKRLQDVTLESRNIVKYVDLVQTKLFYYIALQLCECDLEAYMKELREQNHEDRGIALKKLVEEVLTGLQVLHRAKVIHCDIKPGNVLIDSENNARLADFEISRKMEEGTVHTTRAGTGGWEAAETLVQFGKSRYTTSSDVQVCG